MNRIGSIILWSVIAAAFIGPGTVTSAASAGADFGLALLWAVLLSAIATFVLQEMAARISIASGKDLGEILGQRFASGIGRWLVLALVGGAILLGCAAYQAGNILGATAGAVLGTGWAKAETTLGIAVGAGLFLALGSPKRIAQALSALVALMGLGFCLVALTLAPDGGDLLYGLFVPALPEGSALVAIALFGTTVVPYNLFLGASLARGADLAETRFGLAIAIGLGGLITGAIVVVGTALSGEFAFDALAALLEGRHGPWASDAFALGLFGAGLSSAVTAPLAAALTARGLFSRKGDPRWEPQGWYFRGVWIGVLGVGTCFGLADVRPVAAIILAQAFNGLLLPLVAIFLLRAANDRAGLGKQANGTLANLAGGAVVLSATGLGALGLWRALQTALG